ncbi:HER031Cp [Eremothecium sinecaudum]|uniref:UDP-N-acetylglucosamine--dolichyl-phosphate N-acetylglucosaminephosphotransferase n=1 Tax=Eremothecium sinecaudum TaxID=45286 RepID=A0A0X8HTQ5_9SACH|nr:HER031Cp [Eremothecium sinecaudum]AMD21310.1 HER031Cp [Eremothecium sinecaudum]
MPQLFSLTHLIIAALLLVYSNYSGALYSSIGFAIIGYSATNALIPRVTQSFIQVGLCGKDLGKKGQPLLPETIGAVAATVYLFGMILSIPFLFYKYLVVTSGGGRRDMEVLDKSAELLVFPHGKLSEYLSAILCLQSTVLLGAVDDLFDLRWRHKVIFPVISVIPLLVVYYADFGVTYVLIPKLVRQLFPFLNLRKTINLGWAYYAYMASMSIFCSNSINILAGINGLEVLQSIVLGIVCLCNDTIYMIWGSEEAKESHLFSMVMIIPFIGVSAAIFRWNKWPARVFVGDTYCYFAGMVFAVVGILGHFAKTMMMFFAPQLFNFIYSIPQLFGLVTCPRHRLPRFNPEDGLMYPSKADLKANPPYKIVTKALKVLHSLHLVELTFDKDGEVTECNNLTLINLVLVWAGPMREDRLCYTLCAIQLVVDLMLLCLRHVIGSLVYGQDNLWHIA